MKFKKTEKSKEKYAPKKQKKVKHSSMIGLKLSIIAAFLAVCGVGFLAMFVATNSVQTVSKTNKEVVQIKKDIKSDRDKGVTLTPAISNFILKFVDTFVNQPSEREAFAARQEKLTDFFASGIKLNDSMISDTERKLSDSEIVDYRIENGVNTVYVKTTYDLITHKMVKREVEENKKKVVKEVDEPTKTTCTNLLAVTIEKNGSKISVIALPYFSEYAEPKSGEAKALVNKLEDDKLADVATTNSVNKFLKIFLDKYAGSTKGDIQFLMAQPEALSGNLKLKDFDAQVYKVKKEVVAKVTVNFTEQNTDLVRTENMTLYLSKKDKTYFVDKLVHNMNGDGENVK